MRPVKVDATCRQAEAWVLDFFGLEGKASPLPGDIDRNFLVDCGENGRWVLKAANAGDSRDEVACQVEVLKFLQDSPIANVVPTVRPSVGADHVVQVNVAPGLQSCIRLVSYLEGRPIAGVGDPGPEVRAKIGSLLAELDHKLLGFDHPGAHRTHMWDLVHFRGMRQYRSYADDTIGPIVDEVLHRFDQNVVPQLGRLRRSVVHNDANDYNILVSDRDGQVVLSGLIDFGDLVFTVTVAELAIATAYLMMAADEPIAAARELRVAYEAAFPLTDLERELLPDLTLARLCTTALMAAQGRVTSPDDAYLSISEEPARRLLQLLV